METSDVVNYAGQPRATPEELAYMALIKELPCCVCFAGQQRSQTECHHIVIGNRRLGHFYCLPLCHLHHVNVHLITKAMQRQLWEIGNRKLGIEREWPMSRILPRRVS